MILATHGIIQSQALAAYNPLTTAWIAATGESDTTILTALNTLEQGLIDNSLTSKFIALYPMVGGTATKHKYNFMDARDLDAAYRLSFAGGWTHSITGALPNGTNATANTFIVGFNDLTYNDAHLSMYSRTDSAVVGFDIGNFNAGEYLGLYPRYSDSNAYYISGGTYTFTNNPNGRGFYIGTNNLSTTQTIYKNGSSIASGTGTGTVYGISNFYLGNSGSPYYGNKEFAFASIGNGLSGAEVSILNSLVQTFQTSLSRNV